MASLPTHLRMCRRYEATGLGVRSLSSREVTSWHIHSLHDCREQYQVRRGGTSNPEDGRVARCSEICECQEEVARMGTQPHYSQDSGVQALDKLH